MVEEPGFTVLPPRGAWWGAKQRVGGSAIGPSSGDVAKPAKMDTVRGGHRCMAVLKCSGPKKLKQLARLLLVWSKVRSGIPVLVQSMPTRHRAGRNGQSAACDVTR